MKKNALQQTWHFWFSEPFWWIFLAFFQPRRLEREFVTLYPLRLQRFRGALRLAIPMALLIVSVLLVVYPILVLLRLTSLTINDFLLHAILGIISVIMFSLIEGVILSIIRDAILGIILGISFGIVFGIAFGMAVDIAGGIVLNIAIDIILGIILSIVIGILIGIVSSIVFGMVFGIIKDIIRDIAGGIAGGIAFGIAGGMAGSIAIGMAGGIAKSIAMGTAGGIAGGIVLGIALGIALSITYIIFIFRLPFILVNIPSAIRLYRASCKQPARVFEYLHRSTLYWDEMIYLPLPFLKQTLLIAYDESSEKALEEIAFIAAERPRQIQVARAAALEIALRDLEARQDLAAIAEAADRLAEVLPAASKLTKDQSWTDSIASMSDASRDAARAIAPIGLQGRRKALESLRVNLRWVHPNVAFRDQRLNVRLGRVVETWHAMARKELEYLRRAAQNLGSLDNPYKPGEMLPFKDALFQGRRDLAKELDRALSSNRHPTFLLNGERRMGKTSVLQQLPYLLGSSYISVFYNLQRPGLYASPTTFLDVLANGIQDVLVARGMQARPLIINTSREVVNSARVYLTFERWLAEVEVVLEREGRTLLLAFDEFEILEEAEQAKYMELRPLLNWMRSVIQFHPRIVFLFSGVKTFDEMGVQGGIDWTGYFINVQMLRVSFLKPAEARNLILKPTDEYPGSEIFPSEVVEQILTDTGCHPFLLQAVCSALITSLNVEHREVATLEDVEQAGTRVLSEWVHHFTHLWNRSDEQQRACLEALLGQSYADIAWVVQQTNLDAKVVRRTLQHLLRRDLVTSTPDGMYGLAVPLFRRWLAER